MKFLLETVTCMAIKERVTCIITTAGLELRNKCFFMEKAFRIIFNFNLFI